MKSPYYAYWLLQTLSMLITAALLPKLRVTNIFGVFVLVITLGFVNATIWDTALFFSIPSTLSTHALTLLACNGALFWILAKILPGIEIDGIFTALITPIVFAVTSLFIDHYLKDVDWIRVGEVALQYLTTVREILKSKQG